MISSRKMSASYTALYTIGLSAIVALSPGRAIAQETGLYPPGLSDSQGFGLDLSVDGVFNRSSTAPPVVHPSPTAQPSPAEKSSNSTQIQLFGSSDRLFGIELINGTGDQHLHVRVAVPLLE